MHTFAKSMHTPHAVLCSSLLEAPDRFESFAGAATGSKAPPRVYKLPFPMQVCPVAQHLM